MAKKRRGAPKAPTPVEAPATAKERVLRAALAVFADQGFDGAGTTEIARRAGVTQPLVHYHFDTKEALWRAAVAEVFVRLGALTDGAAAELRDLDPLARMKVMLRRYVRFSAANPEVARFFQREGIHKGERLDWLVEHHARPLSLAIAALIADGQRAGFLKRAPVEMLVCLIITAGSSFFTAPALVAAEHGLDVSDPDTIERYADLLVDVLFNGLARPLPAAPTPRPTAPAPRKRRSP